MYYLFVFLLFSCFTTLTLDSKQEYIDTYTLKERRLIEIEVLKKLVLDSAKLNSFNLHAKEGKDPQAYHIAEITETGFSILRSTQKIFTVSIEKAKEEGENDKIVLTNRPNKDSFNNFDQNHFHFIMGYEPDKLDSEKTKVELKLFFDNAFKTISEKLAHLQNDIDPLTVVNTALNKHIKEASFNLEPLEVSANKSFNNGAAIIIATVKKTGLDIKFLVYPSSENLYTLMLINSSEGFELSFNIYNVDDIIKSARASFVEVFNIRTANLKPNKAYLDKISSYLNTKKCVFPEIKQTNVFNKYQIEFEAEKNLSCPLTYYTIYITLITLEYINSIHIKADSEEMTQEFIINMDKDFDKKIESIFKDLISDIQELNERIKGAQGKEAKELEINQVYDTVNPLKKGSIECGDPSVDRFTCTMTYNAKKFTILKATELTKSEVIRISVIEPPNADGKTKQGYYHPEYIFSKFSSYDQLDKLKNYIQPLFTKLSSAKLI